MSLFWHRNMPWASSRRKQIKSKVLQQGLWMLPCSHHFALTEWMIPDKNISYVINSSFFITNRASIGRWVDNSSKGLQASVGKYKAGVQCLSKADLHKITSTKIRQQDHWQVVAKCHQEKNNWLVQIVNDRLKKLPVLSLVKIIYQDNIWEQVSHDSTDDGNLKWIWEFWGSMQQSKAIMLNNVGFLVTTLYMDNYFTLLWIKTVTVTQVQTVVVHTW